MIVSGGRVTVSTRLRGAPAVKRQLAENVLNASKNMFMFRLDYGLDNLVSNYTILNMVLNLGRSSSIAVVGLTNNSWSRDHWRFSY